MDVMEPNTETTDHLFSEYETFQYTEASTGQRFLNFLIDNVLMRYALNWATGYAIGYFLVYTAPDFYNDIIYQQGVGYYGAALLVSYLNYILYYTFCEKMFRGYTLGKLITGTRALREDGQELSLKDAFLRSLSRCVPFEAFSIWFGSGLWHDTWTNTMVVRSR